MKKYKASELKALSEQELNSIMYVAKEEISQATEMYNLAVAELTRWSSVRCEICQVENVAYRNTPWIGWTTSSGFTLCNICTSKWERKYGVSLTEAPVDNPADEIMALLD